MRLFSRTGAAMFGHGGKTYEPADDGAFEFPEDLANELVTYHVNGQPLWETDLARRQRLVAEEMERRKDPATLLSAVEQILAAAQKTQSGPEPEKKPAARRSSKPAAKD